MLRQCAAEGLGWAVVARGRWCVIFSPLCLLPVGQGLLEQGVADFTEQSGREGSQQDRQENGQTQSTTVVGQQQLAHLTSFAKRLVFVNAKLGLYRTR